MRRRWAAAVVLLTSVLFLHLLVPGPAPDARAAVPATAAVDTGTRDTAPDTGAENVGEPCPCEEDTSDGSPPARSARTAGTAGTGPAVTGVPARASTAGRGGTEVRPAAPAQRPGAAGPARNASELQSFRC
ncbi:hypothetical protein GCM10010129_09230 [Streptomyces fumigatiscleroticus]|nr:hypothetical protein GCM10010129_09230 [Streptomyces fumigatiscleroticus]